MARNPYNGFTPNERTTAGNWYVSRKRRGLIPKPTTCHSCLREGGTVNGHSEDYSAPYGDHIGAHHVCYPCHMAIHARFKYPEAWLRYRAAMRAGAQYPDTSQYGQWIRLFLASHYAPPIVNESRDATWLDGLPLTESEAIARFHADRLPMTLF